ncbi:BspA family leucine-rich repeat surface protein, partial [Acinetobacter pittii]
LSMWNMSSAVNMISMFQQATAFNQDISNWNISKVLDMSNMFNGATSYNQDLSAWCAKFNINVNLTSFLDNSGMSAANYSAFLNALWADIGTTRQGAWIARTTAKILGAANLKYNSTAAAARASLIANGWTITDGGQAA